MNTERENGLYFQGLIYSICEILDNFEGRDLENGKGISIGDASAPSSEIVDSVNRLKEAVEAGQELQRAVKIVEKLNEIAFENGIGGTASFTGQEGYLAIQWGGTTLWDSIAYHLDEETEDEEPTLELCCKRLRSEGESLMQAFER